MALLTHQEPKHFSGSSTSGDGFHLLHPCPSTQSSPTHGQRHTDVSWLARTRGSLVKGTLISVTTFKLMTLTKFRFFNLATSINLKPKFKKRHIKHCI